MDGILDWRWLSPALLATLREEVEEQYAEDLYLARLRRGSAAGKLPPFSATCEGVAPGTVQGLGTLPLPPGIVVPPGANYSEVMDTVIEAPYDGGFFLLKNHPCANVDASGATHAACAEPGKMACSECRLVSYCSKECQKKHWRVHKADCKHPMRSKKWSPAWTRENRMPSFIDVANLGPFNPNKPWRYVPDPPAVFLWGNSPAVDVVRLSHNENDLKLDLNLAFPASGDLRHVVLTVNNLPPDFCGDLKLVINDSAQEVVSRNLVLLLVLGMIPDENLAADIALHFWYSVFFPAEYGTRISAIVHKCLTTLVDKDTGSLSAPLGPRSSLSCTNVESITPFLAHMLTPTNDLEDYRTAYDWARQKPEKQDLRDRMYHGLRPSHRAAFHEYRRFGIVLPFGATDAHFDTPNQSLFSSDLQWLQSDFADPLHGWQMRDVRAAGKQHGTPEEDIYGCLYFYLKDQLRGFVHRLRTLNISITLCGLDATVLSTAIRQGNLTRHGIPSSIKFHRIHVSNILDYNYVGLSRVLEYWAGFLADTKHAVLLGYFINWFCLQPDGQIHGASDAVVARAIRRITESGRYKQDDSTPQATQISFACILPFLDNYYDNSKQFLKFLRKQGLDAALKRHKICLRETHTIVPHRPKVPIDAPSNALPQFANDDSWYYDNFITCHSGAFEPRFVEFCRQSQ